MVDVGLAVYASGSTRCGTVVTTCGAATLAYSTVLRLNTDVSQAERDQGLAKTVKKIKEGDTYAYTAPIVGRVVQYLAGTEALLYLPISMTLFAKSLITLRTGFNQADSLLKKSTTRQDSVLSSQ